MVIYGDVDDVLADFSGAFLDRLNAARGTRFRREDHTDYGFPGMLEPGKQWYDYVPDVTFWASLPLHPWAQELMAAVRGTGYPYAFLSSVFFGAAFDGRKMWLDHHFSADGAPGSKRLILAVRKSLVAREGDVLIDDAPHQIEATRQVGATVFALAMPWNGGVPGQLSPERVIQKVRDLGIK